MTRKPPSPPRLPRFSVQLSADLAKDVDQLGAVAGMTRSDIVRRLLILGLCQAGTDPAALVGAVEVRR